MSSRSRQWVVGIGIIAAVMFASQLPMQRKLASLEREVAQLRQQVGEQAQTMRLAAMTPAQPAPLTVRPRAEWHPADAAHVIVVSRAPGAPQQPAQRSGAAARQATSGESAPMQVARSSKASSAEDLEALSEDELATIYAGAGAPPPGVLASANVPGGTETIPLRADVEQAASRPIRRVEKGGVLLPKGKLQVEPAISYSHLSNNRVGLSGFSVFDVIFIGEIRSDEVKRDIVTSSLNLRYGLSNTLQAELEVPGQFQREDVLSGPIENRQQSITTRLGLSDIGAGFFYQLAREHGSLPNMVAHMKLKAPTGSPPIGSGVWGVKGGLITMKSSDPVVLFSNVGYSLNFPGDVRGVRTDPGDSFEYSVGLAYALNYNLALNGSFEQIFVGQSKSGGSPVTGSQLVVANLKTGLTYAFTRNLSMDVSVGSGLTEDSPDLTVSVSFPYTF